MRVIDVIENINSAQVGP